MTDTLLAPTHRQRKPVLAGPHDSLFAPVDGATTPESAAQHQAVQEVAGYTFQRMRVADPENADASSRSVAVSRDIQFPRIISPQTEASQRFNSLMEQRPRFRRDELTNEVVDYEIVYAGEELISVRFDLGSDTAGAAHPGGVTRGMTVLMQAGELLEAGDVFTVTSGWQDFISERAAEEIGRELREYEFTPTASDVRETAIDTRQWLITETALVLLFPAYSFGAPYVAGSAEVTIPWSDLKPYLSASAPAPIAAR